jgi:acyl carrier protein
MNIELEEFLEFLCEAVEDLERVNLGADTVLEKLEDWDSLARLGVISLAEERFNVRLEGQKLETCKTIAELMGYVIQCAPR